MKLSRITAILASADLPALSVAELRTIAGSVYGKEFEHILLDIEAGYNQRAEDLTRITKALLTPPAQASATPPTQEKKPLAGATHYFSFHIYCKSAALCVSEARTKAHGFHTVQIEGALIDLRSSGREVAWDAKITVQLTPEETFLMLALFEGELAELDFKGHGHRHDKVLSLRVQHGRYWVKLVQDGRAAVNIPVGGPEAMRFISLAYRQILRNHPHMDAGMIRQQLHRIAQMHRQAEEHKQPA